MGSGVSRRDFGLQLARRALAEFRDDRCPQLAASIAYHVLFSIFPLAIVLAGVSGLVLHATGSQADTVDTIVRNVPLSPDGRDQLRHMLLGATGNLSALGLVGVVGLVYSASGMMAALRAALNAAWDVDEERPFLRGKLIDLGLVFLVALLSLASLGATIALQVVGGGGWLGVGVLVPLALGFAVALFLYRVVPAADVRLGDAWPAALLVAAAFAAAENLFAVYVGHFGNYNAVYGSLGAVIAFMFFVFVTSELLLLGAEVASEWPRVRLAFAQGEVARRPGPPLRLRARRAVLGLWVDRRPADDSPPAAMDRETRAQRDERGRRMLILTEQAATVIEEMLSESEAGPDGGLRISGTTDGGGEASLEFALADAPSEGDEVVRERGATVFLDEVAAEVLDDKTLDVHAHDDHFHFSLDDQ